MKRLSILLLVVMVSLSSCAINKEKEMAKDINPSSFQPKPLDDEWSKWLVGEWEVTGESDWLAGELEGSGESNMEGAGKGWAKIELGLNGQFLIIKSEGEMGEMTDEQIQHLKKTTGASDEEIERFLSLPFKGLQIYTIDPKTGEIIGYLFDSLRCIAEGRGKWEGNKEIMEWKWYVSGQGTSIRIKEKVSDDKLVMTEKFTMPDGSMMEEKGVMTRKKETDEK